MIKETIAQDIVEALSNCKEDTLFKRKDIIKIVTDFCNCNPSSVIPSDYCYNRINDGIKNDFETRVHLFDYLGRNCYKYVGPNKKYSCTVMHKPKKGAEYQAGEMKNGIFIPLESYK